MGIVGYQPVQCGASEFVINLSWFLTIYDGQVHLPCPIGINPGGGVGGVKVIGGDLVVVMTENKHIHYTYPPMQYTRTLTYHCCEKDNFQMKNCYTFLFFF